MLEDKVALFKINDFQIEYYRLIGALNFYMWYRKEAMIDFDNNIEEY